MRSTKLVAVLTLGLTLGLVPASLGCGDDATASDGGRDASADGAAPDGSPVPPAAPAVPVLTPCPEGWRATPSGEGFDLCEPFPESGTPNCGRDEGFWPGATECAPIGTPCPPGDFPVDLPAGSTALYVLAGASAGDGSMASPFGSIAEAIAVATAGQIIAVGKGTYAEEILVPGGVTLHGACVAETVITSESETFAAATIQPAGMDVAIRNLRVGNSARLGISVVGEGTSAIVEDVVIHDCFAAGLTAERGGALTVRRVVSRDHRAIAALNAGGRGLSVEYDATADVRWFHIEGCKEYAVLAYSGAEVDLEDTTIIDTTRPTDTALVGLGLLVSEGARLNARRVVIDGATANGIITQNESSRADFEDLVVRHTRPGGLFGEARGLETNDQAQLSCTRCLLTDLREAGVGAGPSSEITLTDTVIRRVDARADDNRSGRGITVQSGAALRLGRVLVSDVREHGVVVDGAGTTLTGTDLTVRRVAPDLSLSTLGRGMTVQASASIEIARMEISEVHEGAIVIGDGVTAILEDLYLHDVEPRSADDYFGRGLSVQGGSSLNLSRARVERVLDIAMAALGEGVTLTATNVGIADVAPQRCTDFECTAAPGGHGIGSYFGASTEVARFDIRGASLCGVQISDGGTMRLEGGVIRETSIGACLQSDAQDLEELNIDVRYLDNGSNLQATMLPVPSALDAVD